MRTLTVVLALGSALCILGTAHAVNVDGDLSDWGSWSGGAFTANTAVQFQSAWEDTNGYITANNSGGEWFDIEGLYVSVTQEGSSTYLNWAIITSYAGLEPNYNWWDPGNTSNSEWNPRWNQTDPTLDNWNGTAYNPGRGTIAAERDGNNTMGPGGTSFVYHRNPTLGLDMDGDGKYEWGLLSGATPTGADQRGGFDTTASLYRLYDPDSQWVTTWVRGMDYPQYVDFNAGGLTAAATGDATRVVGYVEPVSEQSRLNDGNGYPVVTYPTGQGYDGQTAQVWRQDYNWYWEGSIDITGLGMDLTGDANRLVHYSMWCGNDGVNCENGTELFDPPTPEVGTCVLLACSLLGVCGASRRRRRAS